MRRFAAAIAIAAIIASPHSAVGAPKLRASQIELWNNVTGPAAKPLFEMARNTQIDCYDENIKEAKCRLIDRVYGAKLIYDLGNGDEAKWAFATLWYSPDTGNALWFNSYLLRRGSDGQFRSMHQIFGLIGSPLDAVSHNFSSGQFFVTTSTLMPNDSRCCPMGRTLWRVDPNDPNARYVSGFKDPEWKLP